MQQKDPQIFIIGAGAIGAFYGGKLSQSGAKVSVLSRSDYDAVKADGFNIKSPLGDFIFKPESVVNNVADFSGVPDFVIVATKEIGRAHV